MLKELAEHCARLEQLEIQEVDLKEQLEDIKEEIKKLKEQIVPTEMEELGLANIELSDGAKVIVEQTFFGKLTPAAKTWLQDNGHADIIKSEISVPFGRGALSDENYKKILAGLKNLNIDYKTTEEVHHKTMTAFIKEQYSKNPDFPIELFEGFVGKTTKIKKGK